MSAALRWDLRRPAPRRRNAEITRLPIQFRPTQSDARSTPAEIAPCVRIRPARRRDLPEIDALETDRVDSTNGGAFEIAGRGWLDRAVPSGPCRLIVAEAGGRICGYARSLPLRARPAYRGSVELSIYVGSHCTGMGIGRRLYECLFSTLAEAGVRMAYAAVTAENARSRAFHRRLGFREVGALHGAAVKDGSYVDLLWFERALT